MIPGYNLQQAQIDDMHMSKVIEMKSNSLPKPPHFVWASDPILGVFGTAGTAFILSMDSSSSLMSKMVQLLLTLLWCQHNLFRLSQKVYIAVPLVGILASNVPYCGLSIDFSGLT